MAKYCPKCYAGISSEDVVCGNCGNVLKENPGEVEDFYDNWVYPLDPGAPEKIGKIILGLINGDFGKVE
jgi:hypothetical protein